MHTISGQAVPLGARGMVTVEKGAWDSRIAHLFEQWDDDVDAVCVLSAGRPRGYETVQVARAIGVFRVPVFPIVQFSFSICRSRVDG